MVPDPEMVRSFISGMYDVALIEIVVIRCYFNKNFIIMIMILMNKVARHIFLFACVVIHQLAIYGYCFCSYIGL